MPLRKIALTYHFCGEIPCGELGRNVWIDRILWAEVGEQLHWYLACSLQQVYSYSRQKIGCNSNFFFDILKNHARNSSLIYRDARTRVRIRNWSVKCTNLTVERQLIDAARTRGRLYIVNKSKSYLLRVNRELSRAMALREHIGR